MEISEGFVPFRGFNTWYHVVDPRESGCKLPVLVLHGGPGATHHYLESLEALAETGRRLVFYDQLGCGRSDRADESHWNVETYVEEVGAVRRFLGLDRIHLFGNSWGGMLAMEYALTRPEGLASLILASAPSSIPQWVEETGRLRRELPADVQAVLGAHEAAGTTDDPAYREACDVFYRRHVCRLPEWPESVKLTSRFLEEHGEVYRYMNGPSEFHVVGTLTDWDVTGRLREVDIPALVVTGEFDEATPAINRTVSEALPRSESVIYPGASHMAHVEDTAGYCRLLDEFMSRVESSG